MSDVAIGARKLPVGSVGHKTFGWWGMMTVIMTEASLFAYLLFIYYYFAAQYGLDWIPERPKVTLAGLNTLILLASSVFVWWAEQSVKRGARASQLLGLAGGATLGVIFVAIQILEWRQKPFGIHDTSYGSSFYVTTGFHMAHVVVGLLMLAAVLLWSFLGYFDAQRHATISIAAVYWHFVDLIWLTIFFTFYITPYLGSD
ncbi:cytochrome c oxidase subunit 3 [Methylocystis iwaonis]|uniref:cytochrome c oxidase subunit 3 n=1 Tax=Methylocystis iwaonis TaxID=2885079 RepID=UPI002E7ABD58|nr:cytochrome c oxidase subunit 3 [Methylocystis iwaonis]